MKSQTFSFTDNDLKEAAELACNAWYKALPLPEECEPYSFSDSFIKNMELLIKKVKHHETVVLFSKRIIAAIIAVIIGLSLWLTIDTNARAVVRNWFKEVFGTTVLYHYTDNAEITELPNYELSYIPDGFEEVNRFQKSDAKSLLYAQTNGENGFIFECYLLSKNKHIQVSYDKDLNYEKVQVKDLPAEYYAADETSEANTLIWFDETNQIVFIINGNLEKSVILSIAEGVFLYETTNLK